MAKKKKQCIGCGNVRVCPHRYNEYVLCRRCQGWLEKVPVTCFIDICTVCDALRVLVPKFFGGGCLDCFGKRSLANRKRPKTCGACGEAKPLVLRRKGKNAICHDCLHGVRAKDPDKFEPCDDCNQLRKVAARKGNGAPQCVVCLRADLSNFQHCADCGELRFPQYRKGDGSPQCQQCYTDKRPLEKCIGCDRQRKVHKRYPQGPACNVCGNRIRQGKLVLDVR